MRMTNYLAAALAAISMATESFSGAHAGPRHPVEVLRLRERPIDLLGKFITSGFPFQTWAARIVPLSGRNRRPLKRQPHQGIAEIARRRRQIMRGTLTASNGLCISKGRRIISVPFDMLNRGNRVWLSQAAA